LKFARALLFYGISFPRRATRVLSPFIRGTPTFSSSLTYPTEQSGKYVALRLPFSWYSIPSTSRISISDLCRPFACFSSLSSETECLRELRSSFPLSIRCARKFMSAPVYTVLDIPFSCLYWKEHPRRESWMSLDWKNNLAASCDVIAVESYGKYVHLTFLMRGYYSNKLSTINYYLNC